MVVQAYRRWSVTILEHFMPSPFPGMNPYLEQPDVWHDFQQGFVTAIRNALTPQIRPKYIAKIDDNIYLHELDNASRRLLGRPDVMILEPDKPGKSPATNMVADLPKAQGIVLPAVDRIDEPFIEIRDAQYRDLITVIELLSPTNKAEGPDRTQYLSKRHALIASNVNYVEIDLLRGYSRMPMQGLAKCDYCVMVSRCHLRPRVDLWPIGLRETLPRIPVPLRREDSDAVVDLQTLLNDVFDAAGYADYIYSGSPRPSIADADRSWLAEQLGQQLP